MVARENLKKAAAAAKSTKDDSRSGTPDEPTKGGNVFYFGICWFGGTRCRQLSNVLNWF